MELARKLFEFRRLVERLSLDPDAQRELRERKLRSLVDHAYQNVPYYRSLFVDAGIDPASIRTVEDLPRIPITTKDDLRRAGPGRTLARGTDPGSCVRHDTSGSTGKPFPVYVTAAEARTRLLIDLRALWANGLFRARERRVVLGPERSAPQPLYQRLGLFRRDHISPWLPIEEQIERLRRFRPAVLWAYPTALRAVLERLDGRLSAVCRPRALVTSAEIVPPTLIEDLRADLDIECFDFYAAMETGRIAWECRHHAGLHLNADRVILEVVDERDDWGSAVVTALDGRAMPFLRYRLDDLIAWVPEPCPCGLALPLLRSPQGRVADLVRLPNNRAIPSWMFDQVLRPFAEIDRFQVRQRDPSFLAVHVVPLGPLARSTLDAIHARLHELLGESVKAEVHVVRSLLPGPQNGIFVLGP